MGIAFKYSLPFLGTHMLGSKPSRSPGMLEIKPSCNAIYIHHFTRKM
jgi:hypothetical protein